MPALAVRRLPALRSKLDQLEVRAAVIERDLRNGYGILIELGFVLSEPRGPLLDWDEARRRLLAGAARARRIARSLVRFERKMRPHVISALRLTFALLKGGALSLLLSCAILTALMIAILVVAPPG